MALMLVLGLMLTATSGVLVLRAFALARIERRRSLDQIRVYGFRSSTAAAEEQRDVRAALADLSAATGEHALARFAGLRARERALRVLLASAGMYGTSVASFVGARILAA